MISTSSTDDILEQSVAAPSKVKLVIYHQFHGIELVSPVYDSVNATCYLSPDQRVDVGSTTQVGFNIDLSQSESFGALIYNLQRKNTNQSNEEIISSEEVTCTQLFMLWKVTNSKEFLVNPYLAEHDRNHIWNEDNMADLIRCHDMFDIQYDPIEEAWPMHNDTILSIKANVTYEAECYKLETTIFEISRSTVKVNIHNQCSNFTLERIDWVNTGADWSNHPADKVDAGSMKSADLISFLPTFEGVLAYNLTRKNIMLDYLYSRPRIRFFVIWKSEGYEKLCAFVQLIKCGEQYHLDASSLEEYYRKYASQLSTYTGPIKDAWLLDDGIVLMTELDLDFTQKDGVLNIIISEGIRDGRAKRLEWVNLER
jgi:hypothetical protein